MATAKQQEAGEGKVRKARISKDLKKLANKYKHLKNHLIKYKKETGKMPELVDYPDNNVKVRDYEEKDDILYQTDDIIFAHLSKGDRNTGNMYYVIEPFLTEEEKELYDQIENEVFENSLTASMKEEGAASEEGLEETYENIVSVGEKESGILNKFNLNGSKFKVPQEIYDKMLYLLKRNIVSMGPLDPLLKDRTNEDIHVVSSDEVHINNKIFGMMESNIDLGTEEEYKRWLKSMSERVGSPVSQGNPIVDTSLPDGSRLNIIFPDDVSIEGPTLTIRQFEEIPPSVFQIVKWGTMSPELAAYLWLCVETNMSMTIAGETAAGKTTTLNAATTFIPKDNKIVSAEETLELKIPHEAWQRLKTREGDSEAQDVDLFDLVIASLRARPDNLIIGEVRGKEAFNVFQAMQTGHPTMFTFHAGNIVALVHRFTGEPLNVPEAFLGNLNVAMFQNFIKRQGKELRRITSVREIEGFSKQMGGLVTRQVFDWDPVRDITRFLGRNNSFVLEEKVAESMGYSDPRKIYDELDTRADVIRKALAKNLVGYDEAIKVINTYQSGGIDELSKKFDFTF